MSKAGKSSDIASHMEAEVACTLGHKKWVDWDYRHAGSKPEHQDYWRASCGYCGTGRDQTFFTGQSRAK